MNNIKPIDRKYFDQILGVLSQSKSIDSDYLYEVYSAAIEGIGELTANNTLGNIGGINHFEIIQYCIGEYLYSVMNRSKEQIEEFTNNQEIFNSMVSVVADKYLSLSKFSFNEEKMTHKFLPPVSSLYLYINFISNILNGYQKKSPKTTLVTDLLIKSMSIARCTLDLLINGFETEAFSSWRTLHECECTLIVMAKYGNKAVDEYLKHMKYGLAFRDVMDDKEEETRIFNAMKEELKSHNFKSKDIKKFIEYGWLYVCDDFKEEEGYKLNFRDGLERIAGLSEYASRYETSSEIIHSTPLLIYSSKEYFYYVTLLSLYESFFRLERIFVSVFSSNVDTKQMEQYEKMRNVYYAQLVNIHKRESNAFNAWHQTQSIGK